MNEKLSLCMICRDDEENVARIVKNARPWVGEIVIIDTGSSDDSVKAALSAGADVVRKAPELLTDGMLRSFSEARTRSFELATRPWRLWLDTDDDLSDWDLLPQLIDHCERLRNDEGRKGLSVTMWYDYSWTDDRSRCTQSFTRERIVHADDGWTWHRPVHEYLGREGEHPRLELGNDQIRVIHMSRGARGLASDRNLRILQHWEKTTGPTEDPIALYYYLGDEMLNRERFQEAFDYFMKVPQHAKGGWWRARSEFRAARSLMIAERYEEAAELLTNVIKATPEHAHPYWELARALSILKRTDLAVEVMRASFDKTPIMGEDIGLRDTMMSHLGIVNDKKVVV